MYNASFSKTQFRDQSKVTEVLFLCTSLLNIVVTSARKFNNLVTVHLFLIGKNFESRSQSKQKIQNQLRGHNTYNSHTCISSRISHKQVLNRRQMPII